MNTLEELNQAFEKRVREFTDRDELRPSIDTVLYAMQYVLDEGNHFDDKSTLSLVRALNILRDSLQAIYDLRASIVSEEYRIARKKDRQQST